MIEPKALLKKISRVSGHGEARIGRAMRLDRNERTTPLAKDIVEAVWSQISPEEIVAYPELEPLYQKLARFLNVLRQNILLCSGSDTGIKSVFETYVQQGDEVVILTPSYGMFSVYCDMFGATKILMHYDEDFFLPVKRITEKINPKTKLVILANPNHTGTVIQEKDIHSIIEYAAQYNTLVLVDEAYHHFYPETIISYIGQYDNLIVVRSFSKAFGIAALRVGYLISQTQNIQNLDKVRLTHEITSVSAKFAAYLIDHPEIYQAYVKDVEEGKSYIAKECQKIGITVLPSTTNFCFFRLPDFWDAKEMVLSLKKRDVHIKGPFQEVPLNGLIRITLGPEKQMREFMNIFKEILKECQIEAK